MTRQRRLTAGNRPRLCILMPSHWSANLGGAEMQVKMLTERLVSTLAFDVHYVTRHVAQDYSPRGYTIHPIPPVRAVGGTFVLDAPRVLALLKRLQPDVIYQRVASAYTGIAAYFAKTSRRHLVWHVSSDRDLMPLAWRPSWRLPLQLLNRHMIDYGARHADTIIVQNAQQAELLKRNYRRQDGMHISNFHPMPGDIAAKPIDRVTVVWVANIKPLKQPEMFVRLASEFIHLPNVEFLMAGAQQMHGGGWDNLLAAVRRTPNIRYVGALPMDEVDVLLRRAHILVNTSPVEGFPNTFIQAWLRQVPVASLGTNPDGVLDSQEYGFCAAGSYDRLKEQLARLIADHALRDRMGEKAAVFARAHFSEANMEKVIELLAPPALAR